MTIIYINKNLTEEEKQNIINNLQEDEYVVEVEEL